MTDFWDTNIGRGRIFRSLLRCKFVPHNQHFRMNWKVVVNVWMIMVAGGTELLAQPGLCRISGVLEGMDAGNLKLETIVFSNPVSFDAAVQKGVFSFSINQPSPTAYNLRMADNPNSTVTLFCGSDPLILKGFASNLAGVQVTGSEAHRQWSEYQIAVGTLDEKIRRTAEYFDELAQEGKLAPKEDSLRSHYSSLSAERESFVQTWILQHPESYVSAFVIALNYLKQPQAETLVPLFQPLAQTVKDSYYGKVVGENVNRLESLMIGKIAPDFSQNDSNGATISLSSLKGKYVLIDFWASWCGPCRVENPNLVRTYERFKNKLTILGVSLDQKKDPWLKAIQDDQLNWLQVSDLKGWGNEVALRYGVRSIPANFLLDPEGKIIAKGLRGEQLDARLSELIR